MYSSVVLQRMIEKQGDAPPPPTGHHPSKTELDSAIQQQLKNIIKSYILFQTGIAHHHLKRIPIFNEITMCFALEKTYHSLSLWRGQERGTAAKQPLPPCSTVVTVCEHHSRSIFQLCLQTHSRFISISGAWRIKVAESRVTQTTGRRTHTHPKPNLPLPALGNISQRTGLQDSSKMKINKTVQNSPKAVQIFSAVYGSTMLPVKWKWHHASVHYRPGNCQEISQSPKLHTIPIHLLNVCRIRHLKPGHYLRRS